MKTEFTCSVCKKTYPPAPADSCTTGYGNDPKTNAIVCYSCCADRDRADMIQHGDAVLYLTHKPFGTPEIARLDTWRDGTISNWPGSLKMPCRVKRGAHNIARYRYDAWFTGPDGKPWHGVQYGDNTQIVHCKRLKA